MRNLIFLLVFASLIAGCRKPSKKTGRHGDDGKPTKKLERVKFPAPKKLTPYPESETPLPKGLKWVTNDDQPLFASPKAKKGGRFHSFIQSFPHTLRIVGPDSNGSFAGVTRSLNLGLIQMHPVSDKFIPALALSWAYDSDGRTVYYRLDPDVRWSDGQPVTADDYIYTLEFMRSKHIIAPWYNTYYSEEFDKVIKYDDHTIAVVGAKVKPDLLYYYGIEPTPRHFYGDLDKTFVKTYDWAVVPNTGAYDIAEIKKGESITLRRKSDWWGEKKKYYKNRFNVDEVQYKVIRDMNTAWEHFRKGELDSFGLTLPQYWHEKSQISEVEKGYVHKLWYYNDKPQADMAITLNQSVDLFKDKNVRYAFAHSMNIQKVIDTVLRGDYERQQAIQPGYREYSNYRIKSRRFDLKKAEEYFKVAGWQKRGPDGIRVKNGKRFSVEVTYGQAHHTERLVVLKEEAKKAGVELILKKLDGAASFKVMLEKKHQVAWNGWAPQFRPQYWGQYHSDNANKAQTNNLSNTASPELDKMIEEYRSGSQSAEKRAELSRKIQKFIHDEGAIIPTFIVPYFRSAYWRWVQLPEGYATRTSDGITDYDLHWIDEDIKRETIQGMHSKKTFPKTVIINKDNRK